jgi:SagB-type dehydrogenase family enzyme
VQLNIFYNQNDVFSPKILFDKAYSKYQDEVMKAKTVSTSNQSIRNLLLFSAFFLLLFVGFIKVKKGYFYKSQPVPKRYSTQTQLTREYQSTVSLPSPKNSGGTGVYTAIQTRRSVRDYMDKSINLSQVSQLLWSAQGITNSEMGYRAAPSAKSAYPIELYLVANNVAGLEKGVYHYTPTDNKLSKLNLAFDQAAFYKGANEQVSVKSAPAVFVMTAVMGRTQAKFLDSPADSIAREVYQETGHVAQNMYLAAQDLGLGMVVVGGYDPKTLPTSIGLLDIEEPVYLIPVGYKK